MTAEPLTAPFAALIIGFAMLAIGVLLAIATAADAASGRIKPAAIEHDSRLARYLTLGGLFIIAFVTVWRLAQP